MNPAPQRETGCCPRFEPKPWMDDEVVFENKLFLKDRVRSFLHIPLNFGKVMIRNMEKIQAAGAEADEMLLLVDENSLWGSDVHIAIAKEVAAGENVRISGRFLTKVFDGPFKDIRKWVTQMNEYLAEKGETLKKLLYFYTTCPKCAKVYGHNYVVLLAQV